MVLQYITYHAQGLLDKHPYRKTENLLPHRLRLQHHHRRPGLSESAACTPDPVVETQSNQILKPLLRLPQPFSRSRRFLNIVPGSLHAFSPIRSSHHVLRLCLGDLGRPYRQQRDMGSHQQHEEER